VLTPNGALNGERPDYLCNGESDEIQPVVKNDVAVIATGRSDYPNQINNVLAFPGVFRGATVGSYDYDHVHGSRRAIAALVKPQT